MTTTQLIEPRHYAAPRVERRSVREVVHDPHPPACIKCQHHTAAVSQDKHTGDVRLTSHTCHALYNVVTDEPLPLPAENVRGDQELCAREGWYFLGTDIPTAKFEDPEEGTL